MAFATINSHWSYITFGKMCVCVCVCVLPKSGDKRRSWNIVLHLRKNRVFWSHITDVVFWKRHWFKPWTFWPHAFLPSCVRDGSVYFRFNSIDMKYQVWKLGVMFTDHVSSLVSNIVKLLCVFVFVCALVPSKATREVSHPDVHANR